MSGSSMLGALGAGLRQMMQGAQPARQAKRARRWIVLDVESTGLDARRDRLLAIAAIGLHVEGGRPVVALSDSFDAVLRHDAAAAARGGSAREGRAPVDKGNILVHGIGVAAMRAGHDPADALRRFAAWAGDAPRLGFHVAFDRTMIERAEREHLGRASPAYWLDIEPLAALACPGVKARALDEWLAHFRIPCLRRHQAIADVLATSELLLRLWPQLARDGATDATSLARLAAARHWV